MATVDIVTGSVIGTSLQAILMCDDIQPGSDPSYQACKTIYLYHPMGAKIVESSVRIAMSQMRKITIPNSPETRVREAFEAEWKALKANYLIAGTAYLSRIYGIGSLAYVVPGTPDNVAIDLWSLSKAEIYFNLYDPLNTAGSLVLNQDPNAPDFQKNIQGISVAGKRFHTSRSVTLMNEQPVYIAYTSSAFGFVGRSVYQRGLYPLKTFIQSMITDDMVTRKAGLLIAKLRGAGSIVNAMMEKIAGVKRSLLKSGRTENVLSIDVEEEIETLNMTNTDAAMTTARKNIIENIATACGEPAKILLQESFAEGFGEGTEDAKHVIQHIKGIREHMEPLYTFMDKIVQHRAWSPEFYATIQADFPEYEGIDYKEAFYAWQRAFKAEWPSLMEEPESEQVKIDETKLKGLREILESLLPVLDPANKAELVAWAQDNLNEMNERMFRHALTLDIEALAAYEPPVPGMGEDEPGGGEDRDRKDSAGLRVVKQ